MAATPRQIYLRKKKQSFVYIRVTSNAMMVLINNNIPANKGR
jgi:hypothetical protein